MWERKDPVTAGLAAPAFVEFKETEDSSLRFWWMGDGKLWIGSEGMMRPTDERWWPKSESLTDGRRAARRLFGMFAEGADPPLLSEGETWVDGYGMV